MTPVEALTTAPLVEIARSLRRRQVSPLDLVDAYSRRIEQASGLRAFITLPGERARREARRAERRLARGEAGALLGVPIAVKDLFATRGIRTTAGSRILRDWVPARPTFTSLRMASAPPTRGGAWPATHTTPPAARGGRAGVRRSPWWPGSVPAPSDRTPVVRSGSRPRSAVASG
ncbi:MAG: hypothetical protein E6I86_02795 [Chloroflexi bacterium]|nr:MAG: hypothetical protein E6I86_02795 [Chloroflexota bacterium]